MHEHYVHSSRVSEMCCLNTMCIAHTHVVLAIHSTSYGYPSFYMKLYVQYWRLVVADNYGDNSTAVLSEVQFFGVGMYIRTHKSTYSPTQSMIEQCLHP